MPRSFRFLLLPVLAVLSACASQTELQQDQSGSDKMLQSPCACQQLDYQPKNSFTWKGTA